MYNNNMNLEKNFNEHIILTKNNLNSCNEYNFNFYNENKKICKKINSFITIKINLNGKGSIFLREKISKKINKKVIKTKFQDIKKFIILLNLDISIVYKNIMTIHKTKYFSSKNIKNIKILFFKSLKKIKKSLNIKYFSDFTSINNLNKEIENDEISKSDINLKNHELLEKILRETIKEKNCDYCNLKNINIIRIVRF
jgi:hypothetical protein